MQLWMNSMFLLILKLDTSHLACMVATKACASTRATSFHKILALWALSLCHYSGQDSVAIGSPSHGRPASFQHVEVNVGCFTDFQVYFLQMEGGTPSSFLQHGNPKGGWEKYGWLGLGLDNLLKKFMCFFPSAQLRSKEYEDFSKEDGASPSFRSCMILSSSRG